jgi:hypothetical protein
MSGTLFKLALLRTGQEPLIRYDWGRQLYAP